MDRGDATYVGMIGSKTKRATFRNWLRRENGNDALIQKLTCPIGHPNVKDKRPEVIAALVSSEIMVHLHNNAFEDAGSEHPPALQLLSRGY